MCFSSEVGGWGINWEGVVYVYLFLSFSLCVDECVCVCLCKEGGRGCNSALCVHMLVYACACKHACVHVHIYTCRILRQRFILYLVFCLVGWF